MPDGSSIRPAGGVRPTDGRRVSASRRGSALRRPAPTSRRALTHSGGSRRRSAGTRTSTVCSATSSTRRSSCSASTRPACGYTTTARPRCDSSPSAGCHRRSSKIIATLPRDARTPGSTPCANATSGSWPMTSAARCRRSGPSTGGRGSARSATSRSSSATSHWGCSSSTTRPIMPGPRTRRTWRGRSPTRWRPPSTTPGWPASTRTMTGRLRAISELAGRLSRLQDLQGIALAIVAEARRLIDHDTIRVYRVDHETRMCEPIAFQGTFLGMSDPEPSMLRVAIGQGLTGWVAEHAETIRISDAAADPRSVIVRDRGRPRVDAARADDLRRGRPWRDRRLEGGPRPVRRRRRDDPGDLRRLRGPGVRQRHQHGAPAPAAGRARTSARGTAPPARGQRTPAVHPGARRRPRPHRRLAQGDRPVRLADGLQGRSGRRRPTRRRRARPVRRPDPRQREPARVRHHRLGHRQRRGRDVQPGASRPALHPGARHTVRTGVDDRRPAVRQRPHDRHAQHRPDGRGGGGVQRQRIRADPAVRRPGLDRAPERRNAWRGPGAGRSRRADGTAQPRVVPARAGRARRGRLAWPVVRGPDVRPRRVQGVQRRLRPPRRGRLPGRRGRRHRRCDPRGRSALPLRWRRVRGGPPRGRPPGRPRGRGPDPTRGGGPVRGDRRAARDHQRRRRLLPG